MQAKVHSALRAAGRSLLLALGVAVASLAIAASASAQTTIDTISLWDGTSDFNDFGMSPAPTIGQTITAPTNDTVLQDFAFEMKLPTSLTFRGEVYAWDAVAGHATGDAVWESAPTSTTDSSVFQKITFSTGGVTLTAGERYVLFATLLKDTNGTDQGQWGWPDSDTNEYSGGQVVFASATSFSDLLTQWNGAFSWAQRDLAFSASFTPAYQPSFISPVEGSSWKAGKTVPVTVALVGADDSRLPDAEAAALASACGVTLTASGALELSSQCMKYNKRTDQFTYTMRIPRTVIPGPEAITVTASGSGVSGEDSVGITVLPLR